MLSKTESIGLNSALLDALNEHLKHELYSEYLYLGMSAYAESLNLTGMAKWLRLQADEERAHAMKFYDFIVDRGGRVVLQALEQPPVDFGAPLALFEAALAHEREISGRIHRLYGLAERQKDYPSVAFLQWFVSEQVEEEKAASTIVETLKMAGDDKAALLLIDRDLGSRQAEAASGPRTGG